MEGLAMAALEDTTAWAAELERLGARRASPGSSRADAC
jgi:hypothetical protein